MIKNEPATLSTKSSMLAWMIWGITGLYYLFEIILRMLPATMPEELAGIFNINATELGIFTSLYYLSYTSMQIPAGIAVDSFSIRKILFTACLFCLLGFLMIHNTHTLRIAEAGRFIVGFGSAFAYVSALKAASIWLPRNCFGLAICLVDSLGMLGGLFAEIVLVRINVNYGIHYSIIILFCLGIVTALLILLFLKEKTERITTNLNTQKLIESAKSIFFILKNPQIWIIGIIGCLSYLPCSIFTDFWGTPYLQVVYHISKQQSGNLISLLFIGWIIAGPLFGALSDALANRRTPMSWTLLLNALLFSIIIFTPYFFNYLISYNGLLLIFFLAGASMGAHPLVFAMAKENYPLHISGTVIAVTNTLVMSAPFFFHQIVGYILDIHHAKTLIKISPLAYSAHDYAWALAIVPCSLILSLLMMRYIKEANQLKVIDIPRENEEYPSLVVET